MKILALIAAIIIAVHLLTVERRTRKRKKREWERYNRFHKRN